MQRLSPQEEVWCQSGIAAQPLPHPACAYVCGPVTSRLVQHQMKKKACCWPPRMAWQPAHACHRHDETMPPCSNQQAASHVRTRMACCCRRVRQDMQRAGAYARRHPPPPIHMNMPAESILHCPTSVPPCSAAWRAGRAARVGQAMGPAQVLLCTVCQVLSAACGWARTRLADASSARAFEGNQGACINRRAPHAEQNKLPGRGGRHSTELQKRAESAVAHGCSCRPQPAG